MTPSWPVGQFEAVSTSTVRLTRMKASDLYRFIQSDILVDSLSSFAEYTTCTAWWLFLWKLGFRTVRRCGRARANLKATTH